jgi:hypothetical protein
VVRPWSRREGITTEAEARADQAAAASALLQLSAPDRDILLALSWDGLSTPELAEVLGCSVASAYVRVHRARRRLAAIDADDSALVKTIAVSTDAAVTSRPAGRGPLAPDAPKEFR